MTEFYDEHLQQVALSAAAKISGFPKQLDKVSSDIKNLEKMLSEADVCLPYWIEMEVENPLDIRCIGWDKIDGVWRIWHHSSSYEDGGNEKRPLIEMPGSVRLHAHRYLAELLREIENSLPEETIS